MKKQFDDFQKMKLKETCKAIQDMTYTYVNPDTKTPTEVPAKHYETILDKSLEQFLEESLRIEMLNNVYKQIIFLRQEYDKDFVRSLICIDMGLKPTDLSTAETIALEQSYLYVLSKKEKEKKKFHLLDQEYLDEFKRILEDKELHASLLVDQTEELEDDLDEEIDLTLS